MLLLPWLPGYMYMQCMVSHEQPFYLMDSSSIKVYYVRIRLQQSLGATIYGQLLHIYHR